MVHEGVTRTVGLGLQGGGSHAAFGWGVLDRLLDEVANGTLRIAAISGTSGGALNGAVCAYGLATSPAEAQRLLKEFWESVSAHSLWPVEPYRLAMPQSSPARWNVDWSATAIALGMAEQIWSPYWNPWATNYIGEIIDEVIPDFAKLNHPAALAPKLFVCATDVRTTALRIFGPGEISAKSLMASTCYPTLYQAVRIGNSFYWDGGYMANPALNPLLDHTADLLTVLIDPLLTSDGPPTSPRQIVNRINELSFNASWVWEVRQIELINSLLDKGQLKSSKYTLKRFHVIRNDALMEQVGAASKLNPSRDFVYALHDAGWQVADRWFAVHRADIGARSTFDLEREILSRMRGRQVS